MTPRELRQFFENAGEQALQRTNRELHCNWDVDRWADTITDPHWERRFCDLWGMQTEGDKQAMVALTNLRWQKAGFWLAVAALVTTAITSGISLWLTLSSR